MKKNILFMANVLALGGLERVIVTISNDLSSIENVTLYSLKGDTFGYQYKPDLTIINGSGAVQNSLLHPIITARAYFDKRLIQKKRLNYKIIEKDLDFFNYDVVILSEADILYAKLIKKMNKKVKIIGWIHSTFESYRDVYMKDSYDEFLEGLKNIDTVIVLTDNDKKKYAKIHKNVVRISNPLTLDCGDMPKRKKEQKVISFVGRLDYGTKGLDYLIDLGNRLTAGWKISVAGDGKDREKFEQEIASKGLQNNFIIKGSLKEEKLIEHYFLSDIFIVTSRWEGFGLVITEAMSMGLPVVAFDSQGPREIIGVGNKYGLLIENGNSEKLFDAINSLITDKNLRSYYSDQSLKRASNYQIENIIPQWLSIIE